MYSVDDVRQFDNSLKDRIGRFREKLADWLAPHHLTLAEARVHKVLIPMVGVYTPGWQALPAFSWEFLELVTEEGLVGTGEWPIEMDELAKKCLEQLRQDPGTNLLDPELEEPLYMAWWDLVGQVLDKPLHLLWAELFERDFEPPTAVPMAAYTWQRFPDATGKNEVTFDSWPEHAAERARQGFPAIKVSMTAYHPQEHVELVHAIRQAVGPHTAIRVDAHGTWNYQEARRILPRLEDCDLEYIEQPMNALLPHSFYPKGGKPDERFPEQGGFQSEYYFRKMTELRREIRTPFSCHWWTPPILHPTGASVMSNRWEPNWYMLQRYEAADVSVPDILLGPWGLWRVTQLAKFMGMHVTVHSNFELCLQLCFRSAMVAALVYETESAGLYMGTTPRLCHPIDNETIQVSDDVIEGGQFDWTGGHLQLTGEPGHGQRLDPERVRKYLYTPEAVAPHRAYAQQLYCHYLLDRPRPTNQSGWPKQPGPETFARHVYPYSLKEILGAEDKQEIDTELNR